MLLQKDDPYLVTSERKKRRKTDKNLLTPKTKRSKTDKTYGLEVASGSASPSSPEAAQPHTDTPELVEVRCYYYIILLYFGNLTFVFVCR